MAYQRRYFPALTITTTAYGDKSVTTDKLADKAVTTPKVADDAITSDQIVDETIKSGDIKDGEVKTVDIASGAITTDKIASQAVTVDKLEPSIQGIARPLTPGVDTPEIQDAKVTLAKLAPDSVDASKIKPGAVGPTELAVDAVEASRIKDGAVATAKIAGGAVTETKIGTDAVTGPKILNRCIGTTEIAIDGVQSENIKDLHVTEPKLNLNSVSARTIIYDAVTEEKLHAAAFARRHKNSYLSRVIDYSEEFGGLSISDRWVKTLDTASAIIISNEKGLLMKASGGIQRVTRLDFGGRTIGQPGTYRPIMDIWITERNSNEDFGNTIGLWKDVNNFIAFSAHAGLGVTTNWHALSNVGGVSTDVDTGVLVTSAIQLLSIEVVDATHVFFYINGIEVAEINTNIPSAVEVEPRILIVGGSAGADKQMIIKYVSLLLTRPDYP